jgi:hypothetical protein
MPPVDKNEDTPEIAVARDREVKKLIERIHQTCACSVTLSKEPGNALTTVPYLDSEVSKSVILRKFSKKDSTTLCTEFDTQMQKRTKFSHTCVFTTTSMVRDRPDTCDESAFDSI